MMPVTTPKPGKTRIFLDTETTELTWPYLRHGRRIWDLGLIRREVDGTQSELQAFVRIADLGLLEQIPTRIALDTTVPLADRLRTHLPQGTLDALAVGDFWNRHPEIITPHLPTPPVVSEAQLAELLMSGWLAPGADLADPVLIADNPKFDELGLFDLLYRHKWIDRTEPWYYHPADIGAMVGSFLRLPPPWGSVELSRRIGVDPDRYARHTALGDARWAMDRYDALFHPSPPLSAPEPDPQDTAEDLTPDAEPAARSAADSAGEAA